MKTPTKLIRCYQCGGSFYGTKNKKYCSFTCRQNAAKARYIKRIDDGVKYEMKSYELTELQAREWDRRVEERHRWRAGNPDAMDKITKECKALQWTYGQYTTYMYTTSAERFEQIKENRLKELKRKEFLDLCERQE